MKHMYIYINGTTKREFVFDKPGHHTVFFTNLEGTVTFKLARSGVKLDIFGLYDLNQTARRALVTVQHHAAPETQSSLLVKAVVSDKASFAFEGLIRIDKDAQRANAYQKNQNLILSRDAFVSSKPYLEIKADDVRCTHGSTTGGMNAEVLYYLMTRGIDTENARRLYVAGFLGDVFLKLKGQGKKDELIRVRDTIMKPYEKT